MRTVAVVSGLLVTGLIALGAVVACSKDSKAPEPTVQTKSAAVNAIKVENPQVDSADGATKHLVGDHFALDMASTGCKVGAECTMTIKLAIDGDFHINKEYPYRFTANDAPGVDFLGKADDKKKFTKDAGDFVADGEKAGTMTVRFKPSAAGKAKIAGVYKLSLCSADQCQIEEPNLELVIPAS